MRSKFNARKMLGPLKCLVYMKLPYIEHASHDKIMLFVTRYFCATKVKKS